ncbi:MAG: sugar phosphate isomerase/epimerase [Clostridia bacterium]|nr:sugar phosphate isomerase/epimerase [Clostridia bacterium]
MKISVLTVPLQDRSAEEAFAWLHGLGVESVELGAGGYTNDSHLHPAVLLHSGQAVAALKELLAKYDLSISALSCHGNPVHPNRQRAAADHQTFVDTCKIAQTLGVDTVVTFSGCPGDSAGSKFPNWVTCAWPDDYPAILEWQWERVLIPYWKEAAQIAASYGVRRIALEMHPGFCVYNPETLLKLREAVGPTIGANFDPSHLIWQGIDPVAAIKALKGAIYHVHAKDTRIDPQNAAVNGVLDTKSFGQMADRSWIFRTIGYGHDTDYWKSMMSALQLIGYDRAVSIEHEDGLMSTTEGLEKAIEFLKSVIIREKPLDNMFWA